MARFLHESNLSSAIKVIKDYEKESDAKFAVTVQQNYCQQGEFGMPPHGKLLSVVPFVHIYVMLLKIMILIIINK